MRNLLFEGVRDKALERFFPLLQKRGINVSTSQLKNALLTKFVNEGNMHSLSLSSNYYLLGVAIYYFNGNLTSNKRLNILYPTVKDRFIPEICERLDKLIEMLRNSYIDSVGTKWELTEDFGNLPLEKLLKKYNTKINKALGIGVNQQETDNTPQVSDDYTAGKYTYEILYSYDDAQKYKSATSPGAWCITYGQQHYNGYIRMLNIHYVVFAKNGFEKIPRQIGKGYTKKKPHDEYGNSLICVLQSNKSPEPIYITSRWNHGSSMDNTQGTEADHAYTTEEFLNVIGCDKSVLERAFEQWKTNQSKTQKTDRKELNKKKLSAIREFKYIQMLLNGGASVREIYDRYYQMNDKCLYISNCIDNGNDTKINGAYWLTLKINDESWKTLMDRKKIFFDDLLTTNEYAKAIYNEGDSFMTITAYDMPTYIFDRRRHQFFNIDGVKKFQKVSDEFGNGYWRKSDAKYGIVIVNGSQCALVKVDNLKVVRTPRGNPWFEYIGTEPGMKSSMTNYSREIRIEYNATKSKLIHMVYDSSAREDYYYDTERDCFSEILENLPCDAQPDGVYSGLENKYFRFLIKDDTGGYCCTSFFKNIYDNSILTIDGNIYFDFIEGENGLVRYRKRDSKLAYVYDFVKQEHVMLNGEPLICSDMSNSSHGLKYLQIGSLERYFDVYKKYCLIKNQWNYRRELDKNNPYIYEFCIYDMKKRELIHDNNGYYSFYATRSQAWPDFIFLDGNGDAYKPDFQLTEKRRMNRFCRIIREELLRVL